MNYLFDCTPRTKGAEFSPCRTYRYVLWRTWGESLPKAMFIGLNPSTADESEDDPTIRRCIGFAKSWECGGIWMLNLFAFRATKPADMKASEDPVGLANDSYLFDYASDASKVIAAWGVHGAFQKRGIHVTNRLRECCELLCLGKTKDGHPKHPLYLAKNTTLELLEPTR